VVKNIKPEWLTHFYQKRGYKLEIEDVHGLSKLYVKYRSSEADGRLA